MTQTVFSWFSHLLEVSLKRSHRLVQHVGRQREKLLLGEKRNEDRYLHIGIDLPFALAADDGLAGYLPIGIL